MNRKRKHLLCGQDFYGRIQPYHSVVQILQLLSSSFKWSFLKHRSKTPSILGTGKLRGCRCRVLLRSSSSNWFSCIQHRSIGYLICCCGGKFRKQSIINSLSVGEKNNKSSIWLADAFPSVVTQSASPRCFASRLHSRCGVFPAFTVCWKARIRPDATEVFPWNRIGAQIALSTLKSLSTSSFNKTRILWYALNEIWTS